MAGDAVTVFVPGQVYWCKVLGAPRLNYDGDAKEWTYDFMPDDVDFLKEAKLLDRLKTDAKGTIPGDYLRLKKPEKTSEGEPNDPIRVYNSDNEAWDPNQLIGNGTKVVVKLRIVDWGKGKKKSIYTTAIRVEELVPFVSNEFGGYDGDSPKAEPKAKKPKTKAPAEDLDDLDDDVPF